jgi:HSP20 family protein
MNDTAEKPANPQGTTEDTQPAQSQPGGAGQEGQPPSTQTMETPREEGEQQRGMTRRDWFTPSAWAESPVALLRRFSEEMDRLVEEFGLRRGWLGSRFGRGREGGPVPWSPPVEISERENQLIIWADLPGMKKQDITLEVTDDVLTLQGERRPEYEDVPGGERRSERSYGSFYRAIPLPKGVDPASAQVTFQDGVLKITLPLPRREEPKSRRLDIQG